MREHVIRATGKDDKRQSDIYYFSPEGTKLVTYVFAIQFSKKYFLNETEVV